MLLIGTNGGVFRLARLEESRIERDGEVPARFLARAALDGANARGEAFAVTATNSLWHRDAAGQWQEVNGRCVEDELWAFAADPRLVGRLYLGASPAMLYRSDDGGRSWTACESLRKIPGYETWTFPPPPHIPHVRSIAPDPEVAGGVYIGIEEGGVYRSPDGGETWQSLNEGLYWDVHTVTPAPEQERLYATTGGGFYRSDDGGASWRHVTAGIERGYTVPFATTPNRPGRVYTAAAAGPPPTWRSGANAALYRSDDGGERWTRLESGLPERFERMVAAIVTVEPEQVFAASAGSLFASDDGGSTWKTLTAELPPITALAVV